MMKLATTLSFVALFLSAFMAQGFVSVSPVTAANTPSNALFFQPTSSSTPEGETKKKEAARPAYKVTKLQADIGSNVQPTKTRSLLSHVQEKTVGFLVYTYELDKKEFS